MNYHNHLKVVIHQYIKDLYSLSSNFPKHELYGITSQLRRAVVSIMLNYIEGYARRKGDSCKVYKNFMEISYGSLKESKYLLYLCLELEYFKRDDYNRTIEMSEEIGKMLWGTIKNI